MTFKCDFCNEEWEDEIGQVNDYCPRCIHGLLIHKSVFSFDKRYLRTDKEFKVGRTKNAKGRWTRFKEWAKKIADEWTRALTIIEQNRINIVTVDDD